MKNISFIYIFLFTLTSTLAEGVNNAPEQSIVEKYVHYALKIDKNQLISSGKLKCEYLIPDIYPIQIKTKLETFGQINNPDETTLRLILLCVQSRCEKINDLVNSAMNKVIEGNEADQLELMRAYGYKDNEIQLFIAHKAKKRNDENISCTNSIPLWRSFIVDSCLATPMTCTHSNTP